MPKTPPIPLSDFIKYGIILLTAGIQIGIFYETKNTVEKLVVKMAQVERELNRIDLDTKILEVRVNGRGNGGGVIR